jgi:hypothetical protein
MSQRKAHRVMILLFNTKYTMMVVVKQTEILEYLGLMRLLFDRLALLRAFSFPGR